MDTHSELLSAIKKMEKELHRIRHEVSALLKERDELKAALAKAEAKVASQEAIAVAAKQVETTAVNEIPSERAEDKQIDRLLMKTEPQEAMNDVFVPLHDDGDMDEVFEKQLTFEVLHRFSLADRYYYANEFFTGDQAAFVEAMEDIEKMSSWSQVESYLFDVLRLKRGDSVVQDFVKIIRECSH